MSGAEVKDLAYYQANPTAIGELSEDQLDALIAQEGDTGSENEPESGEPPVAAAEPEAKGEGESGNLEPLAETPPIGVATKDGKHVIPFEVLEKQRARVAELERIAQEQSAQIAELSQQAQGKTPDAEQGEVTYLTDEQLSDLEAELPSIGKLLRAQQAQLRTLNETVKTLADDRQAREQDAQRTTQQTVQEAIDGNPKLAYLQSADDQRWQRAVMFDKTLRQDPEWAGKPYAERFAKVVELYEATYGAVQMPGQSAQPKNAQPSPADLAKAAEAKLQGKKASVPSSLSDIPGGSTPASDDVLGALAAKSGPELTADFMRMTPAQIEATLARL